LKEQNEREEAEEKERIEKLAVANYEDAKSMEKGTASVE
jgi:5-methylcytosine-specific restriction endonuclease McrBC GTP-binding regulatory subunit McrB